MLYIFCQKKQSLSQWLWYLDWTEKEWEKWYEYYYLSEINSQKHCLTISNLGNLKSYKVYMVFLKSPCTRSSCTVVANFPNLLWFLLVKRKSWYGIARKFHPAWVSCSYRKCKEKENNQVLPSFPQISKQKKGKILDM